MDFFRAILETKEASSSESSDLSDGLSSTDVSFKEQRRVFIYGPSSSGRTSILFEVAFHYASLGHSVIFVSPEKITKLPVLFESRQKPNAPMLNRIQIVYIGSKNEFLAFMASVHIKYKDARTLILVDNINYFYQDTQKCNELAVVSKIFAFILDACAFFGKLSNMRFGSSSPPCSVVCSASAPTDSSILKSLFLHWFQDCYCIQNGEEKDSFNIFLQKEIDKRDLQQPILSYNIKDDKIWIKKR